MCKGVDNKLISIIIPVYNVDKYLNTCLKSIENQSISNFEVILVDDGSTDTSGKICDDWVMTDTRIKVIHQLNSGVSNARNNGIEASKGDYIIFLDPDDYIERDMLDKMSEYMEKENVDIVCCGYTNEYKDVIHKFKPREGKICNEDILLMLFNSNFFTAIWNKMFRREIIVGDDIVKFPEGIYIGEDFLWLAKVLKKCESLYCLNYIFYHWIRRKESATGISRKVRIDYKAMTEIVAMEEVVKICKTSSKQAYYISSQNYYGLLMSKLKVKEIVYEEIECTRCLNRMRKLIKDFPVHTIKDVARLIKGIIFVVIRYTQLKINKMIKG